MKKLSEAVYRSPKWLQRFADFELRTGEDIKGEPSEKQKERIRKQQEQEKVEREERERQDMIEKEERERRFKAKIARDQWERERREREAKQKKAEQERIEKELNDLFNRIIRDFQNNPYEDKFDTPTVGGKTTFKYRFENGWTFEMNGNEIIYTDDKYRHGYTVGLVWRNKFVQLANEIIAKGKRRPTSSSGSQSGHQKKSEPFRETPKTGNPIKDKYNTLNDKIKLREEQLRKMKPNDPDRTALENELNAYKRVRDKIKKEYKFEKLKINMNT
jgi:hypothetical protein